MKRLEGSIALAQGAPKTRTYTHFRQHTILFLPSQGVIARQWDGPTLVLGPEGRKETGMDEFLDRAQFQRYRRDGLWRRLPVLRIGYSAHSNRKH